MEAGGKQKSGLVVLSWSYKWLESTRIILGPCQGMVSDGDAGGWSLSEGLRCEKGERWVWEGRICWIITVLCSYMHLGGHRPVLEPLCQRLKGGGGMGLGVVIVMELGKGMGVETGGKGLDPCMPRSGQQEWETALGMAMVTQ